MIDVGDRAPALSLLDQNGVEQSLDEMLGRPVIVFFYPKASSPGCTTQAVALRDLSAVRTGVSVVGISPDTPRRLANFDAKHDLGMVLLSDPEHVAADAFGAWGEKKLYGKVYDGVLRSVFLIASDGTIAAAHRSISPKNTAPAMEAALDALEGTS